MIRVGINGFGRIGRSITRLALTETYRDRVTVAHINDLTAPQVAAHLFKYDSVHGQYRGDVTVGDGTLTIDGKEIGVSAVRDPAEVPWGEARADVVLECSGVFRERAQAEKHLAAGAHSVLISAPASGEDITIVYGVNSDQLEREKHRIVSNGSCTTNCLAPVAMVIDRQFKITQGFMTTVHSYTSDQRILDLPHKDLRRARAAGVNMIPTSTGAAKAIGLVLPELAGKIEGMAVRVPTANVSLVDVVFNVERSTTASGVNDLLRDAAHNDLRGVLACTDEPLVSGDFVGNTASSIVDLSCTKVIDGRMVKVMTWYDNEVGFSCRMLDVAMMLGGV